MKRHASRIVAASSVLLCLAAVPVRGFDVVVPVSVPAGATPMAENVKLAPLPAGKKLAVTVFVDWSYRSAKDALPLAEALAQAGWKGTFFLAGAKDIAEFAPKLEALGQEVATNLYSGGISAYRDEMFSYTAQDILNAIGPLRAELNAVLKRPVVTQLVRGHGVPYRDRIRGLGYLGATHWYNSYVFLDRSSGKEARLSMYADPKTIGLTVTNKLDESAYQTAEKEGRRGVVFTVDKLDEPLKAFLASQKPKEEHWHATLAQLFSQVYLQQKAKVSGVKVESGTARLALSLDEDFNPLFLRGPIGLDLGGKVVDLPADALLGGPLEARLSLDPQRISLPGETTLKVTFAQRGRAKVEVVSLSVHAPQGFEVLQPASPAPATAGGSFRIRSDEKAGTHCFGFIPIVVRATYRDGEVPRTLLAAAELEVRPALSVEVFPEDGVPLGPKGTQTFMLTVNNVRAGAGRGNWRNLRPKFEKFILPPEGAVSGTIAFPKGEAFKVEPEKIELGLDAAGEEKRFFVTVTNTGAASAPYVLWPEIRLGGQQRPLLLPFGGTAVHYVEKLGAAALDDKGLLMYASWDSLDGGNSPGAEKARGVKASYQGAMGPGRIGPGLLGQALLHNSVCLLDPFMNFNEAEGTMMFWLRNDPSQKRPFPPRGRERLFAVDTQHPTKNVDTGQMYLGLTENGLYARMMTIGPTYHELRAAFQKSDEWTHVALTWSCPKKSMQLIVDGQLRGELKDENSTWYWLPARRWPYSYGDFMTPLSDDHGAYTSTMRDEFYIYNRPLSAAEIQEHIKQVKAASKKQAQE